MYEVPTSKSKQSVCSIEIVHLQVMQEGQSDQYHTFYSTASLMTLVPKLKI